jgi:hypothetical protein
MSYFSLTLYTLGTESTVKQILPNLDTGCAQHNIHVRVTADVLFVYRINPLKLQSPLRKIQAFLARDPNLKESAQRAFVSYMKSIFLMKNKKIFNIHALDTELYSR